MGVAALGWASLVMSAAGSLKQASASQQMASYQAAVARNNQMIANQNATLALQQGQQKEAAQRQQTAQAISMDRAAASASGLDPNRGSPLRAQSDTASIGELNAQTIRQNAETQAWGYRNQGANFGAQAQLTQMGGQYGALSSIIGGASSVANKWLTYQNQGVFG